MSSHVAQLGHNLRREDISVRNYSAWALWQLSRNKHEIGVAVPELVQLLTDDDEWNAPRKNAIGALLHHAQKSSANLKKVLQHLKKVQLDPKYKEIQRFREKLSSMT
jgi:hypothetical protein